MTAVTSHPPSGQEATLVRIEARLARMERALQPVETVAIQAPLLMATVTEMADALALRMGDVDARTQSLADIAERLTRPQTIETLNRLLEIAEAAPHLVATMTDMADEAMAQLTQHDVPVEHLVQVGSAFVQGLVRLATAPEVRHLLESGMLNPEALGALGRAADALAEASSAPRRRVGAFGALRALGHEDVQSALGFLLEVAQRFGASRNDDRGLPSGT